MLNECCFQINTSQEQTRWMYLILIHNRTTSNHILKVIFCWNSKNNQTNKKNVLCLFSDSRRLQRETGWFSTTILMSIYFISNDVQKVYNKLGATKKHFKYSGIWRCIGKEGITFTQIQLSGKMKDSYCRSKVQIGMKESSSIATKECFATVLYLSGSFLCAESLWTSLSAAANKALLEGPYLLWLVFFLDGYNSKCTHGA